MAICFENIDLLESKVLSLAQFSRRTKFNIRNAFTYSFKHTRVIICNNKVTIAQVSIIPLALLIN